MFQVMLNTMEGRALECVCACAHVLAYLCVRASQCAGVCVCVGVHLCPSLEGEREKEKEPESSPYTGCYVPSPSVSERSKFFFESQSQFFLSHKLITYKR